MKKKLQELNVDFIGGESLTKAEEIALSIFFKAKKEKRVKKSLRKRNSQSTVR